MTRPSLNSMLLASIDPERLGAWYAAALEPEEDTKMDSYRVMRFGGFSMLIDRRSDVGQRNPEPGRMILNFDVADARAIVRRIDDMGGPWLAELEDRDGSLFATALDPDGNYVQIIQLSAKQRAAMQHPEDASMVSHTKAFSGFSVDDIPAAKIFYNQTLGLDVSEENGMLTVHLAGDRDVLVYPKADHTPASFTILNFPVADIDAAVAELTDRGVQFQRYDGFAQDDRGIQRGDEGPPIAWFSDPAGNVLSVLEVE